MDPPGSPAKAVGADMWMLLSIVIFIVLVSMAEGAIRHEER